MITAIDAPATESRTQLSTIGQKIKEYDDRKRAILKALDEMKRDVISELLAIDARVQEFHKSILQELRHLGYDGTNGTKAANGKPKATTATTTVTGAPVPAPPKGTVAGVVPPAAPTEKAAQQPLNRRGPRTFDDPKTFCHICDMKGHDGRAHRGQKKPQKFTKAELLDRELIT